MSLIGIDAVDKYLLILLTVRGEAKMSDENKIPKENKIPEETKTKKEIKIQDLKPKKDAKGGSSGGPGILLPGHEGIPL